MTLGLGSSLGGEEIFHWWLSDFVDAELENGGHLGSMLSMRCWKFDVKKNLVRICVVYYANKNRAFVRRDSVSLSSPLDVVLLSGARHGNSIKTFGFLLQ